MDTWERLTHLTLQRRLAWLTAFGVAFGIFASGFAGYLITRFSMYRQLDKELINIASLSAEPICNDIQNMGGLNSDALHTANINAVLLQADNTLHEVQGTTVRIELNSDELAIARTDRGFSTRTGHGSDGHRYRIVAVPLAVAPMSGPIGHSSGTSGCGDQALIIARDLTPTQNTLTQLGWVMALLGVSMATVAWGVGSFVARQGLAPVRQLSEAVSHVTETDRFQTIEAHGTDELSDLARNFNTMLYSLESSRERQRRLIADASHELRTPLTSMRTNIELLVADDKSGMLPEGARGEILHDVASQLSEFTTLVGDLVQLSREEQVAPAPEKVNVADVVARAVKRAKRRGPNLRFDIQAEPWYLTGEPGSLERAITNLLDNAVKFSPAGGTIRLVMENGLIRISDEGPGIAEEDLPHIFDRFYRSDKARNTPGTGLGLSIVTHTIRSHGGEVWADRAESGGAEFFVQLPGSPDEFPLFED